MELRFDDSIAEYREVSAAEKSTTVRATCSNGCVKIALADSGAVKGRLCRVGFKAIQKGSGSFTLHISQATDAEPRLISGLSDYSLDVDFGEDDISSSSASSRAASSRTNLSASRSTVSGRTDDGDDDDREDFDRDSEIFDLRKNHALKYILIGAGIVILIAALVFAGVLWGKKMATKPKEPASQEPAEQENSDEDTLPEDDAAEEDPTE